MSTMTEVKGATGRSPAPGVVQVTREASGLVVLRLGDASERVVTFTEERLRSLEEALHQLKRDTALRAVVVTGPAPGTFCAGADIKLIESITSPEAGAEAARMGRRIFQMFRELSIPVIAAIEGPCLGGALEMSLFCDLRIASDHPATQIGLPEVKLGIVPGFGGTQNMSRLLGLPTALDLILQGKVLRPKQALRKGLIDRFVPSARLMETARREALALAEAGKKAPARRLRGAAFWLSRIPPLRSLVARRVRKTLASGPARFYPAPQKAMELCVQAFRLTPEQGFEREAQALGELIAGPVSKGLVRIFFLTEHAKRLGKSDAATEVDRAVVIGGGVMGAGIAGLLARKGIWTRLCDLDSSALARAKARLQKDLDKRVRRKRMERHEAVAVQDRLAVSTEWGDLRSADLWLEAVVEDPEVKRRLMVEAVGRGLREDAVLASNTSSLSIDGLAAKASRPERLVGIHFFNPPEKMPLVEVIRGAATSDAVVATASRLAVRLGKFPIVVKDSPGFLVNRCLAPYVNEAARLLIEGNEPEFVDKVMLDFGMPMGPARLMDEVGFDVVCKVSEVMAAAFPRMEPSPLFEAMVGARALGRKSGGGLYGPDGEDKGPGRDVLEQLRGGLPTPSRSATRSEVLQRLIYPMVDEATRCLEEGLVQGEEEVDLGLVFGIGFPPFTGGITRFARSEGYKTIVDALDELARREGPRFSPSDALRRKALS